MKLQTAIRSMLTFTVLAAGVLAHAETFDITLLKPSIVAGTELKPGDYRVDVKGDIATIRHGKKSVETKVRMESTAKKFDSTVVRYELKDDKYKVQEISIGGTNKKLVVEGSGVAAGSL